MDVIVLFNGLGNQMSQYAFYLQKERLHRSVECISFCKDHNGLELDRLFGINLNSSLRRRILYVLFRILLTNRGWVVGRGLRWVLRRLDCKIVKENFNYEFCEKYLNPSKGITFYFGGWHSENYFSPIREEVIDTFGFPAVDDVDNLALVEEIVSSTSVALHVRRGDYLSESNISLFGGVTTIEYFQKAIKLLESQVKDCHFFIFSNDMEWVKRNLHIPRVTYVSTNKGKDSWKDMYLMSICKHNIISNSTFSWWAAWLNTNPDKIVICPSRFLNADLTSAIYPETWQKVFNY